MPSENTKNLLNPETQKTQNADNPNYLFQTLLQPVYTEHKNCRQKNKRVYPHCTAKAASQSGTNYTNWKKNQSELVDTGQRRQARLIEHEWNGKFLHAFVVLPLLRETRFLSAHRTLLVYLGDLLGKT